MGCSQHINYLLVFLFRNIAQLTHLTDDNHLGRYLHQTEIVDGSLHTRGIGIVGIHHQVIMFRHRHLRTIVRRHIVSQGMVYLLERNVVDIADGNGCQHIVEIVGSYQMRLHGLPFTLISSLMVLFAPAELQEGGTAYHLAPYQDIGVVALTVIVDVGQLTMNL